MPTSKCTGVCKCNMERGKGFPVPRRHVLHHVVDVLVDPHRSKVHHMSVVAEKVLVARVPHLSLIHI